MPHQTRRAVREARDTNAQQPVRPGKRRARLIWLAVGVLAVVVFAAGAWVGLRALIVKAELEASQQDIAAIQAGADVNASLQSLGEHSAKAAEAASDPLWRALEFIPIVGDNLRAVRLAAESLDVVANQIGIPILDGTSEQSIVARAIAALEQAEPDVIRLATEVESAASSSFLIGQVKNGIDQVAEVLIPAREVMQIVPTLLGADGAKSYLLVFQNNAETLPLGGSAASQTLIRVDNGSMSIAGQAGSRSYQNGTAVDVEVDQSALDLYSSYLVSHVNTTVSRPDFPTAAKLLTAFWQRDVDPEPIDGVISVDPIALARVLLATGPISVMGHEINSENAVKTLLSDVYQWWDSYEDPETADLFFAAVASQVFDQVASGSFDLKDMLWAVTTSIDRGDIMFYSPDPALAAMIEGERVSGVLPTNNADATTVGVFFRDTSASKIDFYMNSTIDLSATCDAGTSRFDVSSALHLNLSQELADSLPRYVQSFDRGSEIFRTEVFVYGPPGTTLESATVDGRDSRPTRTDISDLGRPVAAFETFLKPGETAAVHATFVGEGDFGPTEVRSTPMIRETTTTVAGGPCG